MGHRIQRRVVSDKERILKETNEAYTRLREDPDAWEEHSKEQKDWEATLADGLDDDLEIVRVPQH